MAVGGKNAPRRPAPVSGPGPFSRRTDGPGQPTRALPNAGYGEQAEFQSIQRGAKMSKQSQPRPDMPEIVPLNAPTMRPDEPVTAGVDRGPGPGSNVLGIPNPAEQRVGDFEKLSKYMPLMEMYAQSPVSSGTLKNFLRYLRSQTG